MSRQATPTLAEGHPQRLADVRPVMAKADLKKLGEQHQREAHGDVLRRSIQLAGWSQKEAAAALDTTEATLSRWLAAKEAQPTWRFQQHPVLGPALLLAQAEDEAGVVVAHVITIARRTT